MWPANWCGRVSDQSLERATTVSGSQTFVLGDVVFAQDEELDWPVMGVSCRITGKRDDHRSWQMGFHSKSQFWILLMGVGSGLLYLTQLFTRLPVNVGRYSKYG